MPETRDGAGSLLDPQTLGRLLQQLEATDVDELEIAHGSSRLFIRREPGVHPPVAALSYDAGEREAPPRSVPITAPLTGVFYSRPSPEQPPFVALGDTIGVGQVVAMIETMKLFNEVTAEIAGEIVSIAASDGELIEAGRALMYVRP
jgi:biotin carboxyl carrier protein